MFDVFIEQASAPQVAQQALVLNSSIRTTFTYPAIRCSDLSIPVVGVDFEP